MLNGVRHRCISTSVNNIFGGQAREPKAGELPHGVKFEGPGGWIYVTRGKLEASSPDLIKEPLKAKKFDLSVSNDHMGNFFDCVRSRKEPVCPFDLGYRVSIACQMAIASYRQQRTVRWDPTTEEII